MLLYVVSWGIMGSIIGLEVNREVDKELTVFLVEDDQQTCDEITAYIDTLDDISLIGVTDRSDRAIEFIRDSLPDSIILDLELHYGSGNGLALLGELRQLGLEKPPYVLITTNNTSAITYEAARQLGADFIQSKHQTDYCSKVAVDFLRMMRPTIQARIGHASTVIPLRSDSPEKIRKRITQRICAELNHIGISTKSVGYQYLVDAIYIVMQGPTHKLCSVIGNKYGKTDSSIERAMQNAIARAWRTTPIEELLQYYTARISSEKGVPTVTEFIYYYAGKIKNEY